ncbi:hypothetical protein ACET3Z_014263 [Daucus carota]
MSVSGLLTPGISNLTGASNFPSIGRVDKLLEIGILKVLAKARPLLSNPDAAKPRRCLVRRDGACTRGQLSGIACHSYGELCFRHKKQQHSTCCNA